MFDGPTQFWGARLDDSQISPTAGFLAHDAGKDTAASSSEDEDVLIYQSKVGDTVQKVATVFKVDVQDLIRTNAKRFPGVSKLNLRYTPLSWYHKGIPAPTSLGPDGPLWEYRNCKTEACLALEFV